MKKTWSIVDKLWKNYFTRRMRMFNASVGSVAFYRAEIWGWQESGSLDKI